MMLYLLNKDHSVSSGTQTTVELVTVKAPPQLTQKLQPIEVQKKQREKPKLAQTPSLELTETGVFESGDGDSLLIQSVGTESGEHTAGFGDALTGVGGFGTDHLAKHYDHKLKYPQAAKKADITEGVLLARAVYTEDHEFLRFEIIEENPKAVFRSILYQLKFTNKDHAHIFHTQYTAYKGPVEDAPGEHSEWFKFVFELNSPEPVRMYFALHH